MTLFNSQYDVTQPFSDKGAQFGLSANTQLSFTVPGDNRVTYLAYFNFPYNAEVWVGLNVNATTPTANVMTPVSGIALNPVSKFVRGGDVLNFKSSANVSDCGIELFTQLG